MSHKKITRNSKIFGLWLNGFQYSEIAKKFGISPARVLFIVDRMATENEWAVRASAAIRRKRNSRL